MANNRLHKDPFRFIGYFLKRFDTEKSATRIVLEKEFYFSIAHTRLVSSYGLMANCDIKPLHPKSSSIDLSYLASIPATLMAMKNPQRIPSIYVCSDALSVFADQVLEQLTTPFILVSGDSDLTVDEGSLGKAFSLLVESPLLVRWYAQNRVGNHSKIHSLPIGLDFHSKWQEPQMWGGGHVLPATQAFELRVAFDVSPLWVNRIPRAYCDWTGTLDRGDRRECKNEIDERACIFPSGQKTRSQTWLDQSQYAFVLSPSGAGPDCHRTWESLALGCVPIVRRHPLCDLFSQLPVIIVDEWSQVTQSFLEHQHMLMQAQQYNYSKILLSTWVDQIGGTSQKHHIPQMMTIAEYRQWATA